MNNTVIEEKKRKNLTDEISMNGKWKMQWFWNVILKCFRRIFELETVERVQGETEEFEILYV